MTISPPDIIIGSIILYFTINGFRHGFIYEISKITSMVFGFIFAHKFHLDIAPFFEPYILNYNILIITSYLSIFFIVVMFINIIANFLTKFFDILLLGWLNKLVGSLLGFIKGIFIVCIIIFVLQIAPQTIIQKLESDSILYQICNNVRINLISSMYLNHDSNPIIKSINNTIENNLNKN
tara:strand:+ start:739 stop:1278 length:540 start_codon:yes stop_codon:yes gene_type:complete